MSAEMSAEMPTEMSAEEIRREMRSRFDAVNKAAEKSRTRSRDAGAIRDADESRRWAKRDANPDGTAAVADMTDNGALGV